MKKHILILSLVLLMGLVLAGPALAVTPPQQEGQVCDCSEDTYSCQDDFATRNEAQTCLDYCRSLGFGDVHHLDRDNDNVACENLPVAPEPASTPAPAEPGPAPAPAPAEPVRTTANLIQNGDFEAGFYMVPELGFEPPDVGNIPLNWNWYRSQAYGKYDIDNNENFGIVCPDNIALDTPARNALGIYIQSTDQSDARLGVYQTVNVTPGVEYLFSMNGVIQVQEGGSSPDINNRVELYFDHTGNTDWRAIPHEKWTQVPFQEQELEFEVTGEEDPDLARVERYYSVVKARSDKMTIFLTAWRRWANWRTTHFTFDCMSLAPLSQVNVAPIVPELAGLSVTTVDQALQGGQVVPQGEPAIVTQPGPGGQPAAQPPAFPAAGGEPEKKNSLWVTLVSIVVISGLVVAGVWNARRQR